jgi:hypothetical protein
MAMAMAMAEDKQRSSETQDRFHESLMNFIPPGARAITGAALMIWEEEVKALRFRDDLLGFAGI